MPVPSRSIVAGSGVAAGEGEPPGLNGATAPSIGVIAAGAGPGSAGTIAAMLDDGGTAGAGAAAPPPPIPPPLGGLGAGGAWAAGGELTAGVFALSVVNDVVLPA